MRIAVFSDVHGNYLNLMSLFEYTKDLNIDKYICLGDLCNYYPDNRRVIDTLREKKITCLLGNHDELYLTGANISEKKKLDYNFDPTLLKSESHLEFLRALPLKEEILGDKKILFCHASPIDLLHTYIYPDTDLSVYKDIDSDIIFIGHTHRQFIRTYNDKIFCNVGSVGAPRDNGSLMGFAILDTANYSIDLYRHNINVTDVKQAYQNQVNNDLIELLDRKEEIKYPYILIYE